jgi:predicted MFS family arabinose efflux permease
MKERMSSSMSKALQDVPRSARASKIDPRILLLALGMFALGTDALVVAGVLPEIAHATMVSESIAGQLVTAFTLTYGLGAPVLAALTNRWSRTRVLVIALFGFCLANVGSALAPTFPLLVLTRILAGGCAATHSPLAYATSTQLSPPEKRGQALALVVSGFTLATVLGSPLGTWVGEHAGWRLSFALVAALAGIACVALLASRLPRAAAQPSLSLQTRLAPVREPRLLLALCPTLLSSLGFYLVYTYIAPLLGQTMHISDISELLIASGLGFVVGSWISGSVADRFGTTRSLVVSLLGLSIMLAIFSWATTGLLTGLPALFLWRRTAASIFTPQQHRLLSLAPAHVNVILALNNAALYLGTAGGAMLGGVALHVLPVTQLGWVGASFALLALFLLLLSLRVSATGSGSRDALIEDLPGKERTTLIERAGTLRKTQARLRETEKGNTS